MHLNFVRTIWALIIAVMTNIIVIYRRRSSSSPSPDRAPDKHATGLRRAVCYRIITRNDKLAAGKTCVRCTTYFYSLLTSKIEIHSLGLGGTIAESVECLACFLRSAACVEGWEGGDEFGDARGAHEAGF